ncbi:hypothetical protein COCVIDRAFT_25394 [Bipolaris victoriae FI3]|uniref:Ribosomal protein S14 n=1 Tax=Bipolaris victoriae (strain FI3) TaxID=930091 RepID=W7EKJ2_BIPV3|nr:hypothetical protein COCVIDRAFT_25394 [Bipolaris victoriae FI3]
MSHESVWYSRPRTYGKGSIGWYLSPSSSQSHCTSSTHSLWFGRREMLMKDDACSVVTGSRKKSGIIRKYGLNMSRQAFREKAQDIGFVKYR